MGSHHPYPVGFTDKLLCTIKGSGSYLQSPTWFGTGISRTVSTNIIGSVHYVQLKWLFCVSPAKVQLVSTGKAFSVVAPNLWNSLPLDTHLAPSLMLFEHQVKTKLFEGAFN